MTAAQAQRQPVVAPGGLIEMHPTHMESLIVDEPPLHSLVSESRAVNSGYYNTVAGRSPGVDGV